MMPNAQQLVNAFAYLRSAIGTASESLGVQIEFIVSVDMVHVMREDVDMVHVMREDDVGFCELASFDDASSVAKWLIDPKLPEDES